MPKSEVICHFSCGATSAIATAIAIRKYDVSEIIYADPGAEHPDNARFLIDCEEKLFQQKVTIVMSDKYDTIFDVFRDKKCLAFIKGAPCTTEMKKIPIRDYLGTRLLESDHCMGFENEPRERIRRIRYFIIN